MTFRPLHDFIHVRKCVNDHIRKDDGSVELYMTDDFIEQTNMAEIVAFGPECKYNWKDSVGKFIWCPELSRGMFCVGPSEFVIRESTLEENGVLAIFDHE